VPDIVELIRAEHVRIGGLTKKLDTALTQSGPVDPVSGPDPIWAALTRYLRFHVDAAKEIAYHALESAESGARFAIMRASEADAAIWETAAEAQLAQPGSRTWLLAVQATCHAAAVHITCMESSPLALLQNQVAPTVRHALGRQWVAFMTAKALDTTPVDRRA
jgi:hypothetical protein